MTAARLRRCLSDLVIRSEDGQPITITITITISISIGMTTLAEDDDDMVSVFDRADQALYRAKTLGRNRSCFI